MWPILKSKFKNESLIWCVLLATYFFTAYGYSNFITSQTSSVHSFFFRWEQDIPFIPWMIVPYMSSDLIFVLCFLLLKEKSDVRLLAKQIAFLISVSVICYFIFPLKMAFHRPETAQSIWHGWYSVLNNDLPFNQCPSLHVSQGLLFWRLLTHITTGKLKPFIIYIWFTLIMTSTLTIYQHHFIDILGGIALGLVAFILFPGLPNKTAHRVSDSLSTHPRHIESRLALIYYLISWIGFSSVFLADPPVLKILSGYLCFSFLILGSTYACKRSTGLVNALGIHKKNGQLSLLSRFLFGPYLALCWLEWMFYSSQKNPWVKVIPNLYFGERLDSWDSLIENSDRWVVLDLAPEISELRLETPKIDYFHYPLLDIIVPNQKQESELITLIEKWLSENRAVYIHCRLGKARSSWVVLKYLVHRLQISEEQALERILKLRRVNTSFTRQRSCA